MLGNDLPYDAAGDHRRDDAGTVRGEYHTCGISNEQVRRLHESSDGAGHWQQSTTTIGDAAVIACQKFSEEFAQGSTTRKARLDTKPDIGSTTLGNHPRVAARCDRPEVQLDPVGEIAFHDNETDSDMKALLTPAGAAQRIVRSTCTNDDLSPHGGPVSQVYSMVLYRSNACPEAEFRASFTCHLLERLVVRNSVKYLASELEFQRTT